jgi:pyridoxine 5-phosphate synthase
MPQAASDRLPFAGLAREDGADGITIYPRPDQRHICDEDAFLLAEWMMRWRPQFELNIEGYPDDRLFKIVEAVRPEQCTSFPTVRQRLRLKRDGSSIRGTRPSSS